MQKREQLCTGLHHPFHHPKTPLWGLGKFSASSSFFFFCTQYDRNLFYNIRLMRISLTFCYKTKNTWRRHAAITGGYLIQRLAQPQVLLPLSHKGLCSLRLFFHGLVANLGKSCSSKSSQHRCNWSIFTAEPRLLASMRLCPVWRVSPDRNPYSFNPYSCKPYKSIHVALICNLSATPLLNLVHLFSGKGQSYYCR